MAPKKKAVWGAAAVTKRSPDPDGTLRIEADIVDGGKKVATLRVSLTADRDLVCEYENLAGEVGLRDFRAWSKGGEPGA